MISRALEAEILRLHYTEHWPIGTIATQLRVHHSTVRRVLAQAGVPSTQKTARPLDCRALPCVYRRDACEISYLARESPDGARTRLSGAPDHFRTIVSRLRPRPAGELDTHGAMPWKQRSRPLSRKTPLGAVRHFIHQHLYRRGQLPPIAVTLPESVRTLSVRPYALSDYEQLSSDPADEHE